MRNAALYSAALHVTIFLLIVYGLPFFSSYETIPESSIVVEVVTVTKPDEPRAPKPRPAEPPKVEEPVRKPAPPQPEPAPPPVAALPPPMPEPKPKPEPEPEPQPRVEPKPKPKPRPKAPPEPVAEPRIKPKRDQTQQEFLAALKSVEQLEKTVERNQRDVEAPNETVVARSLSADVRLSESELDAVRQQIQRCWNVPIGARDAGNLAVEVRVEMNPDRTVRRSMVLDSSRMRTDPFFRAMAESALRAVNNPRCSPLELPPRKYEIWKTFTLNFDPKDMIR